MQASTVSVSILPFEPAFGQAVVDLILPIQQIEFGVPVTAADQPDLLAIPDFYFKGNGHFWVAAVNEKVVGTIGLLDYGNGGFALRKIFVDRDYRGAGNGIAQGLWHTAKKWVEDHEGTVVYLGTVDILKAAHRFYEKNGFSRVDAAGLPGDFPRMAVDTVFYKYLIG